MTLATLPRSSSLAHRCRPVPSTGERRDGELAWTAEFAPGQFHTVPVRYSLWGRPGRPARAALGGISASRRTDHWWSSQFGADCPFDPAQHRILGVDWLDRPWPDGTVVSTQQQAGALAAVLDHLGIDCIDRLVGASYGAMTGLAFAAAFPDRLSHLVAISGADRAHPAAVARRLIQRRIIRLGLAAGDADAGLALARSLALTTYRPDALLAERFDDDDPQAVLDALSGYFDHQGRRCRRDFDVDKYLCLSESLDRHRVDVGAIRCPVDLVAVDSDTLVPEAQIESLASRLGRRARVHRIGSRFGHDAFLKETGRFQALLGQILSGVVR
jgi:homoserine O-acetyltransferase